MKKAITFFVFLFHLVALYSQCYNGSQEPGGSYTPLTNSASLQVGSGTYALFNVKNGGVYYFDHCVSTPSSWNGDTQITVSNTSNNTSYSYVDDNGPVCSGYSASTSWEATFTGQVRVHTNRYNCAGWQGSGTSNSATLRYRCEAPTTIPEGTAGNGTWNIFCYNAGNSAGGSGAWSSNYSGYYTNSNINFNTASHWSNSPSDASTYKGCLIGNDSHSWRAIRTGWSCNVYSITVNNHDDGARLMINGSVVWTVDYWSGSGSNPNTYPVVVWTGVLSSSDIVEFRVSEGGGGSNGRLTISTVGTALNPGGISYTGSTNNCIGYNPPIINSTSLASGGSSGQITNGSTTYQWQLNGVNISGATGSTYDPPSFSSAGTYNYVRVATDKCGTSQNSNTVTITILPNMSSGTVSATSSMCIGGTQTASVSGEELGGGSGSWSSSNTSVATVDASGTVTAVGSGSTDIIYTVSGGCGSTVSSQQSVSVTPNMSSGTVSATSSMCIGGTQTASVSGEELGGGSGSWSSSNTSVATVDASGTVTAVGSGSTDIIYTVSGGCGSTVSSQQSVSVEDNPSTANAGADFYSCLDMAELNANNPSSGTGSWSWSGPGTVSYINGTNNTNPNAEVSFSVSGTYIGTWTIATSNCGSSSDMVTVEVNNPLTLANSDLTATCQSNSNNDWIHLYDDNGYIIASINDRGQNLGDVTASLYYHGGSPLYANSSKWCTNRAVLNRSFVINTTQAPTSNVSIRFYFTDSELNSLISFSGCGTSTGVCDSEDDVCYIGDLFVTQVIGATNEDGVFTDGDGTTALLLPSNSGTGNNHFGANYLEIEATDLSEFWIHGTQSLAPLPVKLIHFAATANKRDIELQWITATEINNKGFFIERSIDGIDFKQLNFVNGNGTTSEKQEYLYKDLTAKENTRYYYRLKQVDFDGSIEYSKIVNARINIESIIEIIGDLRPNPTEVGGKVSLTVQSNQNKQLDITILNSLGLVVGHLTENISAGNNEIIFNIPKLASGTYYVSFVSGKMSETKKLLIIN